MFLAHLNLQRKAHYAQDRVDHGWQHVCQVLRKVALPIDPRPQNAQGDAAHADAVSLEGSSHLGGESFYDPTQQIGMPKTHQQLAQSDCYERVPLVGGQPQTQPSYETRDETDYSAHARLGTYQLFSRLAIHHYWRGTYGEDWRINCKALDDAGSLELLRSLARKRGGQKV